MPGGIRPSLRCIKRCQPVACADRWVHESSGSWVIVQYEGGHALEYTDIYLRMYPALEEVTADLDESDPHAEVVVPTHVALA